MKRKPDLDKLRGGYYTPAPIAHYLANWAIRRPDEKVLEPSCGDGNILVEAARRLRELGSSGTLTGVELLSDEAVAARMRVGCEGLASFDVEIASFFDFAARALESGHAYDVVVGNPPFIRYQDFVEEQRQKAFGLMRRLGLNPSRMANAWLPFLAVSCALLSERGRLAMVIPAELFQVGYAAELRRYLVEFFPQINIVTFKRLVFPDIQQEVVLLLAERGRPRARGIRVHEVEDAQNLTDIDLDRLSKKPFKPVDHASEKWTKYFLDKNEILLLRELRERADVPQLGAFVDIDVGLVTGANDYFLLDADERDALGLTDCTVPIVGRSAALPGTIFSPEDFKRWEIEGKKAHMFLPVVPYSRGAKRYIKQGEAQGVNSGYKCRIRKEWYVVPSVWTPDFFFLRQADNAPRLVANMTNAQCTDTLHRGRLLDGLSKEELATAFTNSLTVAASEVTGRSYGGGVMTFEPSEVERLPLPVKGIEQLDPHRVDRFIRDKDLAGALDYVDRVLLVDGLGLKPSQVDSLRTIWKKLRDRRRGRKR